MSEDANKILAALQELRTEVTELRTEVAGVRTEVATLRKRFEAQPDLRLIGQHISVMMQETASNGHEIRQVIAAINQLAHENVTPGEVEAIHGDLDKHRKSYLDHEARIRRLEAELRLNS